MHGSGILQARKPVLVDLCCESRDLFRIEIDPQIQKRFGGRCLRDFRRDRHVDAVQRDTRRRVVNDFLTEENTLLALRGDAHRGTHTRCERHVARVREADCIHARNAQFEATVVRSMRGDQLHQHRQVRLFRIRVVFLRHRHISYDQCNVREVRKRCLMLQTYCSILETWRLTQERCCLGDSR